MTLILSGTDGLSDVDGSAATPAIRGTDANTGIFFPAADTIAFAEGGAEVMRINSSGNVGINTTAPRAKLSVTNGAENTSGDAPQEAIITGANQAITAGLGILTVQSNTAIAADVGATIALGGRIRNTGTTTDASNFAVIKGAKENATSDNSAGYFAISTKPNGVAPVERMRIDSSGNLLVGTTSSSGSGNLIAAGVYNNTTASGANVQVDNTGPGLLRRSTSSIVYKTDVEPIAPEYINNALKFRPVWYRSLCEGDRKDWSWYGLIAEEVGAVDPRLVHWRSLDTTVDANGNTVQTPLEKPVAEGVMYDRVVVLALGLIQEQQALITALTTRIEALEAK